MWLFLAFEGRQAPPFAPRLRDGKRRCVCRTCEAASVAICFASASRQASPFAPHLYRTRSLVLCACFPNDFALRNGARVGISESNMGKEWRFFVEKVKKRSARDSPANRFWRRHPDLNRGVRVLQTLALPLGYGAKPAPKRSRWGKNKNSAEIYDWSGKRDSNPRHSPWQGDALPLSYSRIIMIPRCAGGNNRARTCDPLLVRQMLSQLSYASELA